MSLIIAATFDTQTDAKHAADALLATGLDPAMVCVFAINPPGQHASLPMGGDHHASHGANSAGREAAAGAGIGGAVGLGVGLATTPLTGPVGAVAGAAIGAYVGSLAGAMHGLHDENEITADDPHPQPARRGGVMVAVNASQTTVEEDAVKALRRAGGQQLERALGVWRNGVWENFDPASAPHLIEEPAQHVA